MSHIKCSLKESEYRCTCVYILAENNNKMLEKGKAFIGGYGIHKLPFSPDLKSSFIQTELKVCRVKLNSNCSSQLKMAYM